MDSPMLIFLTPDIVVFILGFIGVILIIISFFGCYGALRKSLMLGGGIGFMYLAYKFNEILHPEK